MGLIGLRNTGMGTVRMADGWDQLGRPWVQLLEVTLKPGEFRPPSSHCTDFTVLAILEAAGSQVFHERIVEISDHFDRHIELV
jgi:hypothetical protein